MTPSTSHALGQASCTTSERIQESVQSPSEDGASISERTMGKNVPASVSQVGQSRISDVRLRLRKNGTQVVGLGKKVLSEKSIFRESGFRNLAVSGSYSGSKAKDADDPKFAKKLRSIYDLEAPCVKIKPEGPHLEAVRRLHLPNLLHPIMGSPVLDQRLDLNIVFPCASSYSSHHVPIMPIFLNHQNLSKYSNPQTVFISSDGTDLQDPLRSVQFFPNNRNLLDDSVLRNVELESHSDALDTRKSVVQLQESSLASETRTSYEDLKIERGNASSKKLWRPFTDENGESRPSISSESTAEIHIPVPHYVRLREEFKGYALGISPLGIGVLRGSSTSSFRPVRRKRSHCNFCPMSFNNNGQLTGHMRIHTGDKPFKCDSCSKAFARNEELTRHKRIHSGLRPHICDICTKKFGRKDHLNKHRKTHLKTSEKKIFHCRYDGCGHSYTRSDALTRHQSTAHNIRHSQQRLVGPRKRTSVQKQQALVVVPQH